MAAGSLGALAILCAVATTYWVMGRVLPAWITPRTSVAGVAHARSEELPAPPIARRLVVIVIDGLGFDHARSLAELEPVRKRAAFRELVAEYPTFTLPNVTAMVTGLPPRESGVRLNGIGEGVVADDVLHSAWDSAVYVRVRSRTFPDFLRAVRAPAQADKRGGRWSVVADLALDRVRPPMSPNGEAADLVELIHYGEVDDAGHEHGSASSQYKRAAADAGGFVVNVASRLDPRSDLLLVLSDHGHRRERGHGGDEAEVHRAFLLAWGTRVAASPEPLPARRMIDVASTISVVLGVPAPSTNLGAPMLDLFDLDETARARAALEPFDQASRFSCALEETASCAKVASMTAELRAGAFGSDASELIATLRDEREASAARREVSARRTRLAAGLVLSAAALALARRRRRAWPRARFGWAAPLVLFFGYAAVLLAIGYRPTLSAMAGTEYFFGDATKASLFGVALTSFVGVRLRWGLREAGFLLLAVGAAFLPLALYVGADPRALSPNVPSAIVFMTSPSVAAAAVASLLLSTATLVRHRRFALRVRAARGS